MSRINERELRLSQDLIAVQSAYNRCLKHRDELAEELELLKKLYAAKMEEAEARLKRVEKTLSRKSKTKATEQQKGE